MNEKSLLLSYLGYFSKDFPKMSLNAVPSYVRLFPMLLGGSASHVKITSSFLSKSSFLRSDSLSNSSEKYKVNLSSNPYYQKYAEKIEKLKQINPNEYAKRMASLETMHSVEPKEEKPKESQTPFNEIDDVNRTFSQSGGSKSLNSILNLEKVRELSSDDIRTLWIEYYANKDAVCAVIPSPAYQCIRSIAILYPVFVYPVPRKDGYEMFVGQYSDDEFHFTSLVNYQRHQDNAVVQLSLKHYTELEDDKDIVLMSGMIASDHGITVTDAQLLSYLVQHFHMEHSNLMERFNLSSNTFNFEDIINAMDEALLMKAGKSTK